MSARFDAVLFDFDGVIVDSEPLHFAAWVEAVAPLGIQVEWAYYREHCVGTHERFTLQLLGALAPSPCDAETLEAAYSRKKEIFSRTLFAAPPFAEGLRELLGALRKEYRLGLVSSTNRYVIEPALAAGGFDGVFELLVCGREAEQVKPAPHPYLRAAALLAAKNPLAVEDSASGIASARAAGFEVLVIPRPEDVTRLLCERLNFDPRKNGALR